MRFNLHNNIIYYNLVARNYIFLTIKKLEKLKSYCYENPKRERTHPLTD